MLNFDFLEKGLGIVCMTFQKKKLSYYVVLTDQISLSH